jgi:hypothetical protein
MLSSPTLQLNESETLLWTILRNFEALALNQYEKNVPSLATAQKKELITALVSQVPTNEALDSTTLSQPVKELLESATSDSETKTLIIQGLLLEVLGQTIYQTIKENDKFTGPTHDLCDVGITARQSLKEETHKLIAEKIGSGDDVYKTFISVSRPVVLCLDALGESLDQHFNEKFGISFSDLMGEFVAELVSTSIELGMERRKVVSYLTSTLMGI